MESRGRRVHSIEKAIRLLDCFWEADSPLSLHELEQRTGWAKSTIHGLLATMLDSAVVEQNPTDGKYRLGYHLFELGSAVRGFRVGDVVSGEGHIVCGTCRNCRAGNRYLCPNTVGIGVQRDGAFAEYLVIPADNVIVCPPEISEDLCSSFDPLGNAVHTALTYDVVGEDVLITGAGPIGIMAAVICEHIGARKIVITDVNPYRLNLVTEMCRAVPVNVAEQKIEDVMHGLGMREGFDVGLEMSGNGSAFRMMVDTMKNGVKIALLGIHSAPPQIDWDKVVFHGLTIQGIYGRKMFETWYKMIAMLESGLDVDRVLTHRFDVRDFEKGFEVMNTGKSGKVVLDWTKLHEEGTR